MAGELDQCLAANAESPTATDGRRLPKAKNSPLGGSIRRKAD